MKLTKKTERRSASGLPNQSSEIYNHGEAAIGINFSLKAPAGFDKHWIPTVPGKGWNGMFRLYGPLT